MRNKLFVQKGFTFIELLVVIAIIGGLAGFMIFNYPAAQKRSRDTQRKSDIKQYQTSLEIFANKEGGLYPRETDASGETNATLCTDIGLATCPDDPRDGAACGTATCGYKYQTESCGTADGQVCAANYVLWAPLEQTNDAGNTYYFVVCSTGAAGETDISIPPSAGGCPL